MPSQHSTEKEANQEQGIVVPLELEGLRILKQEVQPDGAPDALARTARTPQSAHRPADRPRSFSLQQGVGKRGEREETDLLQTQGPAGTGEAFAVHEI